MAVLKVKTYGDPVLVKKSSPFKSVTKEARQLATNLLETMYEFGGVGLAAPQVGIARQLIVVDTKKPGGKLILLDPRVVSQGSSTDVLEEGCLSLPGIYEEVSRPTRATITALNLAGKIVEIEAEGFLARVLQHEIDHLRGTLFIDYLTPARRKSALRKYAQGGVVAGKPKIGSI